MPQTAKISETGTWQDENGNERVDKGESVSFSGMVTNTGTMTLDELEVTGDNIFCHKPPSGLLGPGEQFQCDCSSQVLHLDAACYRFTRSPITGQDASRSWNPHDGLEGCAAFEFKVDRVCNLSVSHLVCLGRRVSSFNAIVHARYVCVQMGSTRFPRSALLFN